LRIVEYQNLISLTLKKNPMEVNWWLIGIVAFCTVIIIAFLIWKNFKDEKEVTKTFFNDEIKPEKHDLYEEEN